MSNKYASIQKTLVIVESPAKCKKIEEYLGPGYKCMASYGHLRELNTLKNIQITDATFTPQFTIIDNAIKKKHIEVLRKEINNSREVILATDDDREGEAIAWHICMLFKLNPESTKRIIFHEITKSAIEQSMRNPSTINMNIVYAQQARQMIDLFVGFHISPLLWKYIAYNSKNALSAGRCQTPALRLLYDNEKEIRSNPGTKAYKITGYFTNQCIPFELNHDISTAPTTSIPQEEPVLDFLEYSANNANNHIYSRTNPERTFKTPPQPFTTSRLQQVSSNELHVSPKETMKICQKLYEAGYITYMRTDSNKYSGEFIETAKEYILQKYDEKYLNSNINMHLLGEDTASATTTNTTSTSTPHPPLKKTKQSKGNAKTKTKTNDTIGGAHEAIRPTNIKMQQIDSDKFSPREKKMYKLIWRNTLQSCMSNAEYFSFTSKIQIHPSATTNSQKSQNTHIPHTYHYKYHTEQLIFPGWKIADPTFSPTQPSQSEKHYTYLLHLPIDTPVLYKKITATLTIKNQKQHYTEAKLIQLLEEKGIGRPSTFSMLIDKIQEKEYAVKQDVKGQTIECKDYEIEYDDKTRTASDIYEIETSREIGNEKSKLVIQPLGMIVLDFLEGHFLSLFDYDFTGRMENDLDKVAKGGKNYNEVCKECLDLITDLVDFSAVPVPQTDETDETSTTTLKPKAIIKPTKIEYKIDDYHYYIIAKNGPVIKCVQSAKQTIDPQPQTQELLSTQTTTEKSKRGRKPKPKDNITFLSIRKDIQLDIEKLKRGEYKLADLVDADANTASPNSKPNENNLGKWEDASAEPDQQHDIIIKTGKFGTYAVCGEMKKSLKCFGNRPISNITLEEVVPILFGGTGTSSSNPHSKIVRQITESLSIRDGKYGNYIFYKTQKMKKPRFISLTGFKGNIQEETEDNLKKWIRENCHIDV
jgi:DNA topoisomerase-1